MAIARIIMLSAWGQYVLIVKSKKCIVLIPGSAPTLHQAKNWPDLLNAT